MALSRLLSSALYHPDAPPLLDPDLAVVAVLPSDLDESSSQAFNFAVTSGGQLRRFVSTLLALDRVLADQKKHAMPYDPAWLATTLVGLSFSMPEKDACSVCLLGNGSVDRLYVVAKAMTRYVLSPDPSGELVVSHYRRHAPGRPFEFYDRAPLPRFLAKHAF